jgi:two-component sensor histidine kinase
MHEAEHDRIVELEADAARVLARLREVDHRMKNDLQLISSIFVLQLRRTPEGPEREVLRGAIERVGAIAAVHRRLDVLDDAQHFEASVLVRDLVEEAIGAVPPDGVRIELDLAPAKAPTRQAAPLALIVGELVRNSLRHAFPERGGVLSVAFGPVDGAIRLRVRDDGVGLPAGQAPPRGFGAALVALLAQQLRGDVEIGPAHPGVAAVVRFPQSP